MINKNRLVLLFAIPLLFSTQLQAEEVRYSSWASGQSENDSQLLQELSELIDQGERDRAADRRFLRDLRDLVSRYDNPWQRELLFDDFRVNGRHDAPKWKIVSGDFHVERDYGLRSKFTPPAANGKDEDKSRSVEDELAAALVGALFNRNGDGDSRVVVTTARRAETYLKQPISNVFELDMELHLFDLTHNMEVRLFRGDARRVGYRITLLAGDQPTLRLEYVGARGRSVLESIPVTTELVDGRSHKIKWNRSDDGRMRVSMDGRELISVIDRSDNAPFAGVTLVNRGGDYAVREISIRGSD